MGLSERPHRGPPLPSPVGTAGPGGRGAAGNGVTQLPEVPRLPAATRPEPPLIRLGRCEVPTAEPPPTPARWDCPRFNCIVPPLPLPGGGSGERRFRLKTPSSGPRITGDVAGRRGGIGQWVPSPHCRVTP